MDRGLIMSSVIGISDISNNEILNEDVRNLNYEYYMALGIRDNDKYIPHGFSSIVLFEFGDIYIDKISMQF